MQPAPAPSSLVKRLLLSTTLSTVAITFLAVALGLGLALNARKEQLRESGERHMAFLAQSLEPPLWSLDQEMAKSIGLALSQDQDVALLEISGAHGEPLFRHANGQSLAFESRQAIRHQDQTIGQVRLGMADPQRTQTILNLLLPALAFVLLAIVVQSVSVRLVLRPMVARAFAGLNGLVDSLRAGDFSARPGMNHDAEFLPLVQLLGSMADTIEGQVARLREGEEQLQAIFDGVSEAIFLHDPATGAILRTNRRMQELFGYSEEEALHVRVGKLSGGDSDYSEEKALALIRRAAAGERLRFEWLTENKAGHRFWVEVSLCSAMIGPNLSVLAAVRDITDRKLAEDELRRQRQLLENIINTMPQAVFWKDRDSAYLGCNKLFKHYAGLLESDDVLGRTDYELPGTMTYAEQYRADDQEVMRTAEAKMHIIEPFQCSDGTTLWLSTSKVPLKDEHGASYGVLGVFEDITERRAAEERLRQSEEKFSQLFQLSPEAIMLVHMDSTLLVDTNRAFTMLSGYERHEVLGRSVEDIRFHVDHDRRELLLSLLKREGRAENFELPLRRKDGRVALCSLTCAVVDIDGNRHILVMARDITEVKRMQEMMVQTEKMISVGGIAAGIAHEINNPLGIVLQAAQNLTQRLKPDFSKNIEAAQAAGLDLAALDRYARARKLGLFLEDIHCAATRASDIIRHMLDFSRRSESQRKLCNLAAIIDKAVELASSDYDLKKSFDFKRIKILRDIDPELPQVNCTETEIEQVLLNILRNAAQAMGSVVPPIQEPRIEIHAHATQSRVRVEIHDNGPGMTMEVQRRVFEPFFTTKPPGVGTGLGLSVSYFIVTKGHHGSLFVSSKPGEGAAFTMVLPLGLPEDALEDDSRG